MINLSQKNVAQIAKETSFIKDNVEKVMRLCDILEYIFTSKWKEKLALKGGTAINLFYRELPRLSVDIDFDYIGDTKEEMEKDKEELWAFLQMSLFQKNYSLSPQSKRYFALDSLVFQYVNNAGNRDNIKIEINYLDRKHVLPLNEKAIDTPVAKSDVKIKLLDACELFGSKLAALIGRCKPRDIYDVYGLIENHIIENKPMLKKCTVFYNCIAGDANICDLSLDILDGVTERDISRQLKPMLRKTDRFKKEVAIFSVKDYLRGLFVFSDDEKEFIREFKGKNYRPELLFEEEEIVARISSHPMALWRVRKENQ
jgi:predicted nucleotidyltransferase component of viral defense system